MPSVSSELFAAVYSLVSTYKTWVEPNYRELKLAKFSTEAMITFCRLHEAGDIYPDFSALRKTADLCDAFLGGRIEEVNLLAELRKKLLQDRDAVMPYDEALGSLMSPIPTATFMTARDWEIVKPASAEEFQTALLLIDFMTNNTDVDTGLSLISPGQRRDIKMMIGSLEHTINGIFPKPEA